MQTWSAFLTALAVFLIFTYGYFSSKVYVGDEHSSAPNVSFAPEHMQPVAPKRASAPVYGLVRRVDVGQRKVVALTFDFCELETQTTGYNVKLVEFLQKNKIPATLFLGGKWLRTHARRGLELLSWPLFEIANHAWSHANFALLDAQNMDKQVQWMQAQYEALDAQRHAISGRIFTPQRLSLFRFPYGRSSEAALRYMQKSGLMVIQWDVVGEIFEDDGTMQAAQALFRKVRPGSILLFHGNMVPKRTEVLVPKIVKLLQDAGYTFTSVGDLLTMGTPEVVHDGYFYKPGDNVIFDTRFGPHGTGKKEQ